MDRLNVHVPVKLGKVAVVWQTYETGDGTGKIHRRLKQGRGPTVNIKGTIRATIVVSGVRSPYILSNIQESVSNNMEYDLEEDLDLGLETFE